MISLFLSALRSLSLSPSPPFLSLPLSLTLFYSFIHTIVLEGIRLAGKTVGDGVSEFLSDPQRMLATVGVISGVALGVYAARSGTGVVAQHVSRRLATPPLVRETSRKSAVLHPIQAVKSTFAKRSADPLEGIILTPSTTERLKDVTIATANTRQNR